MELIKAANLIENPLKQCLSDLQTYRFGKQKFNISHKTSNELRKESIDEFLDLIKVNVKHFYKTIKLRWNERKRREDMEMDDARYLVAKDDQEVFAGFSMFKFVLDYERPVLYCYELQIKDEYQGKGLGSHLMECLEDIAQTSSMELIVLTALTNNIKAMQFYEKRGFMLDETDPDKDEYQILSKSTTK